MRLDDDQITHVITIGEDITEWYRIHQRIMQSEKLAAVGQLAAGVMHEINNPLATIGACVDAVEGRLDEVPPSAQGAFEEYLDIIDNEVERCKRIVDGLLDFSRPRGMEKRRWTSTPSSRTRSSCSSTTTGSSASRCTGTSHGPAAGPRQRRAADPGVHGADAQRARRDGGRRDPHRAHRLGGPRGTEVLVAVPDTGVRHPARRPPEDLRAVLHHQAAGARHRARPLHLLRHRRRPPRPHRGGQHAGPRLHLHRLLPGSP